MPKARLAPRCSPPRPKPKPITRVAEAIKASNTDPATYMLAMKYIETLREMTSGQNNKTVYIPYEASSVLSSIGSIKEMFANK